MIVHLFAEHRRAVDRIADLEKQLAVLVERDIRLQEELERNQKAIEAMNAHIAANPSHLTGMMDLFNKYQEHVLQEKPFTDNVIPDDYWLTGNGVPEIKETDA